MEIEEILEYDDHYRDWVATVMVRQGTDWDEFPCGIHSKKEDAEQAIRSIVHNVSKLTTLEEVRNEIEYRF